LITAEGGPQTVKFIHSLGGRVFYDGKFDDIPNTIGRATKVVAGLGVDMFNLHASASIDAMMEAVANKGDSICLVVTELTSIDEEDSSLIFGLPSKAKVLQFARDAKLAGCDGIICSPQELQLFSKHKELSGLRKYTPGVRPEWAPANDQKRHMTPGEAIKAGATGVIIGRPITDPPEKIGTPVDAVKKIDREIQIAMEGKNERN